MVNSSGKTLRLIVPQWQGGTLPAYQFGAYLLDWLAPETEGPAETIDVDAANDDELPTENGVVARTALLRQADAARKIILKHNPDKLVVLGGDCLVDLAPFAYLNERYDGDLAVLWVDTHPDVITPEHFSHAHAMVLGNLLGEGDGDFAKRVKKPISPSNVMIAGIFDMMPFEKAFIEKNGLATSTPTELAMSSEPVLEWFRSTGAKHLAIHLDLDVLDPSLFRSLYFSNPKDAPGTFGSIPQGRMTMDDVVRILSDISEIAEVVGLGITEHLPWDALALRNMLSKLPILKDGSSSKY